MERLDFKGGWKCKDGRRGFVLALFLALLPFYPVVLAKRQRCCFNHSSWNTRNQLVLETKAEDSQVKVRLQALRHGSSGTIAGKPLPVPRDGPARASGCEKSV